MTIQKANTAVKTNGQKQEEKCYPDTKPLELIGFWTLSIVQYSKNSKN
jgi:hypothetical protein